MQSVPLTKAPPTMSTVTTTPTTIIITNIKRTTNSTSTIQTFATPATATPSKSMRTIKKPTTTIAQGPVSRAANKMLVATPLANQNNSDTTIQKSQTTVTTTINYPSTLSNKTVIPESLTTTAEIFYGRNTVFSQASSELTPESGRTKPTTNSSSKGQTTSNYLRKIQKQTSELDLSDSVNTHESMTNTKSGYTGVDHTGGFGSLITTTGIMIATDNDNGHSSYTNHSLKNHGKSINLRPDNVTPSIQSLESTTSNIIASNLTRVSSSGNTPTTPLSSSISTTTQLTVETITTENININSTTLGTLQNSSSEPVVSVGPDERNITITQSTANRRDPIYTADNLSPTTIKETSTNSIITSIPTIQRTETQGQQGAITYKITATDDTKLKSHSGIVPAAPTTIEASTSGSVITTVDKAKTLSTTQTLSTSTADEISTSIVNQMTSTEQSFKFTRITFEKDTSRNIDATIPLSTPTTNVKTIDINSDNNKLTLGTGNGFQKDKDAATSANGSDDQTLNDYTFHKGADNNTTNSSENTATGTMDINKNTTPTNDFLQMLQKPEGKNKRK